MKRFDVPLLFSAICLATLGSFGCRGRSTTAVSRLAYTAYREISGSNSEGTEKTEEEQPSGSRGPEPSFTGRKDDAEYAMKQAKYCDERADWAIKMKDYSSANSWIAKAKEWRAQAAK